MSGSAGSDMVIETGIKTSEEIKIMAEGGQILASIIDRVVTAANPGVKTINLDQIAEELITVAGYTPSFKNYRENPKDKPYPASLCVSINDEIVHGIPSQYVIKKGDVVSLDLGLYYKGYHLDMARTINIGNSNKREVLLVDATFRALMAGIEEVRPGKHFGDIGYAIKKTGDDCGFAVVRELCGHGIGHHLHEEPQILNYGRRYSGEEIKEGMVFCIEPMLTMGHSQIKRSKDGFAFVTADGSTAAHFEHTIAVTKQGYRILTVL